MSQFDAFEDRYDYLQLGGQVGESTFGVDRWINQKFYHSREWRLVRDHVIVRDMGFDLGAEDMPVRGRPLIHHINPLQVSDIVEATENMLEPEFLITTSHRTHNAIHYGDRSQLPRQTIVERRPGDTTLWRQ